MLKVDASVHSLLAPILTAVVVAVVEVDSPARTLAVMPLVGVVVGFLPKAVVSLRLLHETMP